TAAGHIAGRRQRGGREGGGYLEDARRPALAHVSSGARAPTAARDTATSLARASSGARAPAASAGASSDARAPATLAGASSGDRAPAGAGSHTATTVRGASPVPRPPPAPARHTATTVRGGVSARGRPRARSLRGAGGHHEHE